MGNLKNFMRLFAATSCALACGRGDAGMVDDTGMTAGTEPDASSGSGPPATDAGEASSTADTGTTSSPSGAMTGSSDESGSSSTGDVADGCPPVAFTTVTGDGFGELAGWKVAMLGDFDGDGVGDYAISSPRADTMLDTDVGRIRIVRGGDDYDDFDLADVGNARAGWVIEGEATDHRAGEQLVGPGDVDGDGRDDLMAVSLVDGEASAAGRVSVVYGRARPSDGDHIDLEDVRGGQGGFAVDGRAMLTFGTGPRFATRAGDVNDDGLADLLFSSPLVDGFAGPGRADVIFGRADAPTSLVMAPDGPVPGDGLSFAASLGVAGVLLGGGGDVNGDGIADVLVSVYAPEPQLYVMFGGGDVEERRPADIAAGSGGFTVAFALGDERRFDVSTVDIVGDVNDDGYDDIAFGIEGLVGERGEPAGAAIVFGRDTTLPLDLDELDPDDGFVTTRGSDRNPALGNDVRRVGDMNGDGYDDVMILAPADPVDAPGVPEGISGRVYVAYGGDNLGAVDFDALLADDGGFVIESGGINDDFGRAATSGSDVNGDGIPDIVVGAPQDGNGGSVRVVYGFNETCPRVE